MTTDAAKRNDSGVVATPDVACLSAYVERTLPRLGHVVALERIVGGQSNPTFIVRCEGGGAIMRAKPAAAGELLPSAHAIEREYAVMQALVGAAFPVPRMLALCTDESVIGVAFYLMELVAGDVVRDVSAPGVAPAVRAELYDAMNATIAQLHAIDPAAIGLATFGSEGNYMERQVRRWTKQYRASQTETMPAMDALIEWLPRHLPASAERRIVHGDFRMENLILDAAHIRVVAVIDWELSTLGDPLADFAYHCLPWHMPPGENKGLEGLDLRVLGIPDEAEYRVKYAQRTGRAIDATWHVYIAFNFFRLAAILQGVYKRATEGRATSPAAMHAAARARLMAERGWHAAGEGPR